MKNLKFKLFISIFAFALVLPASASAYSTTNQTATRLNADTVLYTITYKFGFLNRELLMPIIAKEALSETTFPNFVEYAIADETNKIVANVDTKAIVLSNDKDVLVKDGQYYLPKGKAAEFTLMALVKIPELALVEDQNIVMQIINFPFTLINGNESTKVKLDSSQLGDYRTPAVSF